MGTPETTGVVENLTIYPLTGARGIDLEEAVLDRGGLVGDHVYVLYEEDVEDGGLKRVSQKQCRDLAQIVVRLDDEGGLQAERDPKLVATGAEAWKVAVPALAQASLAEVIHVSEFGKPTPCHDLGQSPADAFTTLLGKDVRLARKTDDWLAGRIINPADRTNATIHIGLAETLETLVSKLPAVDGQRPTIPPDRLRAQIVIRGFPPFADAAWVGGRLVFDDAGIIEIDRLTERCPVPGNDQRTSEKRRDLPRAYPHAVRDKDGKTPTIGVYGHSVSESPVTIKLGSVVRWLKD